jgi:hypothetical protein
MPAEAGIQEVKDYNNFKDLDSCFRRNDAIFLIATQPPEGGGKGGGDMVNFFCNV